MTQLTTEEVLVTPEVAEMLLQKNTRNRPISKPYVRDLARELQEGRWQKTHQGVAISPDGVVVDGQHRLLAIVQSGIAMPMLITHGVEESAFDAIDQGRRRTAAQVLSMHGISKDAPRIVAMARAILSVAHQAGPVSNTAAVKYALEHQEILERYLPVARKHTPAVAAAFAWADILGWPDMHDAAVRLLERLFTGDDPMRALAKRAEDFNAMGQGQAGIKARFDLALTCLIAVRDGRKMKVARGGTIDYGALQHDSKSSPDRVDDDQEPPARPSGLPLPSMAAVRAVKQSEIEYDDEDEPAPGVPREPPPGSLAYGG